MDENAAPADEHSGLPVAIIASLRRPSRIHIRFRKPLRSPPFSA